MAVRHDGGRGIIRTSGMVALTGFFLGLLRAKAASGDGRLIGPPFLRRGSCFIRPLPFLF